MPHFINRSFFPFLLSFLSIISVLQLSTCLAEQIPLNGAGVSSPTIHAGDSKHPHPAPFESGTRTVAVAWATPYLTPMAPGTAANCHDYREYQRARRSMADPAKLEAGINSCLFVSRDYGIHMSDLLAWNPSLTTSKHCSLKKGYRYCVQRDTTPIG